jgi:hypothetical protein
LRRCWCSTWLLAILLEARVLLSTHAVGLKSLEAARVAVRGRIAVKRLWGDGDATGTLSPACERAVRAVDEVRSI